jgi:hypothetical protein
LQLRALAKICRALGDEGRLRLFKRILAAGTVGIDAGAFVHSSELDVLIEAGLVSPLDSSGEGRLRAEPNLLGLALVFLFGDDQ